MTSDQVLALRKLLVQDELKRQKEIEGLAKVIQAFIERVDALEKNVSHLSRLSGHILEVMAGDELSTDLSTGIGQKRERRDQNEDSI